MLPYVMDYNMPQREDKYAEVAKILAPSKPASGTTAIDAVVQLRADIGIDRSITDLGGQDDLLPVLVEDAAADPVNFSNPIPVDQAALESLIALRGKRGRLVASADVQNRIGGRGEIG